MKKILRSAIVLLTALACTNNDTLLADPIAAGHSNGKKKEKYTYDLSSFTQFKEMQGAPLSDKLNEVWSVKLVFDLHDNTLYFLNSTRYRYHYQFCWDVLGDNSPLDVYNTVNYGNTLQRKYVLANLNYYLSSHIYAIEFSSEDRVSDKQLAYLYAKLMKTTCMHDSIKLLVNSDYLLALDKIGTLKMPRVYAGEIYKSQKYQLLNPGIAYGILRRSAGNDGASFSERDIVLVNGTPVNVPVCAGVITNSFQTPLSHINILCHNRNIPSAACAGIFNDANVTDNMNKPVRLEVNSSGAFITSCDMSDVDIFNQRRPIVTTVVLRSNVQVQGLLMVKDFGLKQKDIIGNKAAGLGELCKVAQRKKSQFCIPEGAFAIPFYYYQQHISQPAIKRKIDDLVKMQSENAPENKIAVQLKLIRNAIKDQPIDSVLLSNVIAVMRSNNAGNACRFRSSSNAEDAAGFSAAGLYDSKTGKLDDKDKPVDMAIKKVWASIFNDAAYRERRACHIDERSIMMGILVHRGFPDEIANGVAITKNLYRDGFPGFTVNVQVGEVPVVSPPDSVVCEQFICMKANDIDPSNLDMTIDYIATSNLTNNQPVLTRAQVARLYVALESVRDHFYNIPLDKLESRELLGLDIEFKFDNNNKLYLKQVRPYR